MNHLVRLVLTGALAASILLAQDIGILQGAARNPATGEPLAGVSVTLRAISAGRDQALRATSDENGRFEIANLKPGRYELSCEKPGFIRFNQRVAISSGTARVDATMPPAGRISGRVILGPGRVAAGIPVEIRHRGGRPRYTTFTDADGNYHFDVLPPGHYFLSAGARGAALRKDNAYRMPEAVAAEDVEMGWAPTFFPGVAAVTEAQPISLKAATELSGYDLRLLRVPVHAIRGFVADERGAPVAGAKLELTTTDTWFGAEAETVTGDGGAFVLNGVRAEDWTLRASAQRGETKLQGVADVSLSRSSLEKVRVDLSPPFAVGGFVDRDEPRDADGKRKVSGIHLASASDGSMVALVFHEQGGSFLFPNIYPGRYRILPLGFIPNWYLDSVRLGDRDALKAPVDLRPGGPPIRIVYRPRAGRVRGVLDRARGAHIVLLPAEETLWDSQFIRTATVDAAGQFEVGSLRPGEYVAFAFEEAQDMDAWSDPALVRPMLSRGVRVTVRAGEVGEVKLPVTPGGI